MGLCLNLSLASEITHLLHCLDLFHIFFSTEMGFTTVLLVFLMTNQSLGVQLSDSDKVERYIREIIKQFQEKPTDIKFSSIIQPSADKRCIYKS